MRFLILILHTHTAHSNDWKYYKYRLQLSQMHSWGDTPRQARETCDTCVSYNIFPRWRFIATTRRRSRSRQTCLRSSAMAGPPCGARARTGGRRCAWRGAARGRRAPRDARWSAQPRTARRRRRRGGWRNGGGAHCRRAASQHRSACRASSPPRRGPRRGDARGEAPAARRRVRGAPRAAAPPSARGAACLP